MILFQKKFLLVKVYKAFIFSPFKLYDDLERYCCYQNLILQYFQYIIYFHFLSFQIYNLLRCLLYVYN